MSHSMNHEGMAMYFFTNNTGYYVLFKDAYIDTDRKFITACICSCMFGMITTFLFFLTKKLEAKAEKETNFNKRLLLSALGVITYSSRMAAHYIEGSEYFCFEYHTYSSVC